MKHVNLNETAKASEAGRIALAQRQAAESAVQLVECDGARTISLPVGIGDVVRCERQGDDLVLVLANGETIVLSDYFVVEADGGPALQLVDGDTGAYVDVSFDPDQMALVHPVATAGEAAPLGFLNSGWGAVAGAAVFAGAVGGIAAAAGAFDSDGKKAFQNVGDGEIVTGGNGPDGFRVTSDDFGSIDGGDGEDTVKPADGIDLDENALEKISNVEKIDLSDGSHTLTLTPDLVKHITSQGSNAALAIDGDSADTVTLDGFAKVKSPSNGGAVPERGVGATQYDEYTKEGVTVKVQHGIHPKGLVGGPADDHLEAGSGETKNGQAGNDIITITDTDFTSIDGGDGEDTVKFTGSIQWDNAMIGKLHAIEHINLKDNTKSDSMALTDDDVRKITSVSGGKATLIIEGYEDSAAEESKTDAVTLTGFMKDTEATSKDGYTAYSKGDVTVYVTDSINPTDLIDSYEVTDAVFTDDITGPTVQTADHVLNKQEFNNGKGADDNGLEVKVTFNTEVQEPDGVDVKFVLTRAPSSTTQFWSGTAWVDDKASAHEFTAHVDNGQTSGTTSPIDLSAHVADFTDGDYKIQVTEIDGDGEKAEESNTFDFSIHTAVATVNSAALTANTAPPALLTDLQGDPKAEGKGLDLTVNLSAAETGKVTVQLYDTDGVAIAGSARPADITSGDSVNLTADLSKAPAGKSSLRATFEDGQYGSISDPVLLYHINRADPTGDDLDAGSEEKHIVIGSDQVDTLTGAGDKDIIYGGAGNDKLTANGDDDYLIGGAGNDYIDGKQGSDIYVFGTDTAGDTDTIKYFAIKNGGAVDKLDLSTLVSSASEQSVDKLIDDGYLKLDEATTKADGTPWQSSTKLKLVIDQDGKPSSKGDITTIIFENIDWDTSTDADHMAAPDHGKAYLKDWFDNHHLILG